MTKKATIREVAELAGLSVTTVSLVLNGKGQRFADETRSKVRAASKRLGYHPDYFARGLVGQRGSSIGVVVPDILNPFFATFVQQISEVAIPEGYFPQIFSVNGFHENVDNFIEQFAGGTQRGLILAAPDASEEIVSNLTQVGSLPVVLIDQAEMSSDSDRIVIDETDAGESIAKHLIELGHQRIAMVIPEKLPVNLKRRLSGFQKAFNNAGIPFPEDLIYRRSFGPEGGLEAVSAVLKSNATAIIAVNDDMAVGVYRGLSAAGKKIPEDYSVVGFDDIPLAQYLTPQLTTVRQPMQQLAETAISCIIDRFDHPDRPSQIFRLKTHLVVRDSTNKLNRERRKN